LIAADQRPSNVASRPSIVADYQPSIVVSQASIASELLDEDMLQSENDEIDYVSGPGHTFPHSNVDSYYTTRGRAVKWRECADPESILVEIKNQKFICVRSVMRYYSNHIYVSVLM
jgi:hypothetical protein